MEAAIIGVGITSFGKHLSRSLKDLGNEAVKEAVNDADISPDDVDMAFVANSMSAITTGQVSIVGQTILRAAGFAGIPVFNVDNACASSSSALSLAVHAVAAGAANLVLVLGVEKLYAAERRLSYVALNGAADQDFVAQSQVDTESESIFVTNIYPQRIRAYKSRYPLSAETLAQISVKNRRHAGLNPLAQYRTPISVEDVLTSHVIASPITALMCAPIADGAAAVVVARGENSWMRARKPVWIKASAIGMGCAPDGTSSTSKVAARAYAQAGISPQDVDLAEVHDSTAFTELLAYEELGFCEPGNTRELVDHGSTALGGSLPINPSGGLESRGHPVAATGLAQLVELAIQLRGDAGDRQVEDARIALAENAGGYTDGDTAAIAVTILASEPEP